MRKLHRLLTGCAAATLLLSGTAFAATVTGVVRDEAGKPVPFVRINISAPQGVPATTSVFSAADGSFASPEIRAAAEALAIESFRIGWSEAGREVVKQGDNLELSITVKRMENVASQVPASAWVPGKR